MFKQEIRKKFRDSVFTRDKFRCKCCGKPGKDRQGGDLWKKFHKIEPLEELDSHHIISRDLFENGGYVTSNGVSVCSDCHLKCERYWLCGVAMDGFSVEDLFKLIDSSEEKAVKDDNLFRDKLIKIEKNNKTNIIKKSSK